MHLTHYYFLLNLAICISYIVTYTTIRLCYFISPTKKLKLARFLLLSSLFIFIVVANLNFPKTLENVYHYTPNFIHTKQFISASSNYTLKTLASTPRFSPKISYFLLVITTCLAGWTLFFTLYLISLIKLRNIYRHSFCLHKIHGTHILFSHLTDMPFCWSWVNQNFICIPQHFLTKRDHLRLIMQHELQHIRQGDTNWLHVISILKIFFCFNPFIFLWISLLKQLQEFACDEAIIFTKNVSTTTYAQCLIDSMKYKFRFVTGSEIALSATTKSILYRRVNMMFGYKKTNRKFPLILVYLFSICVIISAAFAFASNENKKNHMLTSTEVETIIQRSNLDKNFQITATPEVVSALNKFRNNPEEHAFILSALENMKTYQPYIQDQLTKNNMPKELLAIPLIESGYKPLDAAKNRVAAAGIWQIIPSTATRLGLVINAQHDDRLNTELSTKAALTYLKLLHDQFHDWTLVILSYEYGENYINEMLMKSNTQDVWKIARSSIAPKDLKEYLAMFNASVIIMHNPSLVLE